MGWNLSSRQLTSVETAVLRYGLNFAPAPRTIPIPKIVASVESGIRDLPESNKESVRATITNILKYSKPPTTSKLSRQQKLALKNLRKDESITIIPADKGKPIVVMDNDDYSRKMNDLLNDKDTYLKITDRRRNPVSKVENGLRKLLSNIKKTPSEHDPDTFQIHKQLYLNLHGTPASLPHHFAPLLVVLTPYIQSVETLSENIIPSYYREICSQK